MANLNKVMLIGRLTRDPEVRTFSGGSGKVASFGFAVNNRRKNQSTGQWDEEPVFIDMSVFNRGEMGRQADLAEQYLRKGHQVFIEGHLKLDQWTSPEGQKRSKLTVIVDNFQFLEPRSESAAGDMGRPPRQAPVARRPSNPAPPAAGFDEAAPDLEPTDGRGGDEEIPF
jgi:single-strand DNA-binding protein